MKTPQILERNFRDGVVRQNHKTAWFNATDLNRIANNYRTQIGLGKKNIADYLRNDSQREFFKEIMDREDLSKVFEAKKGKNGGTWVHPLVLIDFAMWLSPDFKYQAMKWLEDELVKHRDQSGDSYNKLRRAINEYYDREPAKVGIAIPKVASIIKKFLNCEDWNKCSGEKLKMRDEIQNRLSLLLRAKIEINQALKIVLDDFIESKRPLNELN